MPFSVLTFKQVLGGETLSVDVKQKESKKVTFRLPIIMISNMSEEEFLEECSHEKGIRERILFVHANSKAYKVQIKQAVEEKISQKRKRHD